VPPAALVARIPEPVRLDAYRQMNAGEVLYFLTFTPDEECFFRGDDPFFQARKTPGLLWGHASARMPWPGLDEMDAYHCQLDFHLLSSAPRPELEEYFRYALDQLQLVALDPLSLLQAEGEPESTQVSQDFVEEAGLLLERDDLAALAKSARAMLMLSNPALRLSSVLRWVLFLLDLPETPVVVIRKLLGSITDPAPLNRGALVADYPVGVAGARPEVPTPVLPGLSAVLDGIMATQRLILAMPIEQSWHQGRFRAAVQALAACLQARGQTDLLPALETVMADAIRLQMPELALEWLDQQGKGTDQPAGAQASVVAVAAPVDALTDARAGRKPEDAAVSVKSIKVDQVKIDRLMNLIGEMVVAKNALPYLANRAESVFGVREMAREIKGQYSVINRIAEEMQDAIMQVRMMPVSFVFQRFPRLVRDISHKLNKSVNLVLEGEDTEADKNIIESLGDPLVHIVRNSLDHGFEPAIERIAAGKPATGTLTLRAVQESDRVVIDIIDDGGGIDPQRVKAKALQKGLLDETALSRLSEQEVLELVFAPGFSTAEVISDLSGRGVGMDVVRTAVEKVGGTLALESRKGAGTRICLSLPLSMAVSNVLVVEADGQRFGVPMDVVVETVRVPRSAVRTIRHSMATVLRGRIIPLRAINSLLGLASGPLINEHDELAILIIRIGNEMVGLLVDDFHQTVDIILKPLTGVLARLKEYSGSALMGDGSVLMVLNVKELF
jgi:two-component system chemotaxis sensor kinase CheA